MAKSRFEYVKNYELPDSLLPNTYTVVRVDGRGFHKFSDSHGFEKPNDVPALELMNRAAISVMESCSDVVMAFGESDEYSFLIRRSAQLFNRRKSKINSTVVSIFTSSYVFYWARYFPDRPLQYPPSFDSRVVSYPGVQEVRDYFGWRQADTHINNLQNTCFWALVKSGLSTTESNRVLSGTDAKDKNELLFKRFGINYNNVPVMFRKGSTCVREGGKHGVVVMHEDVIRDGFWDERPWLLNLTLYIHAMSALAQKAVMKVLKGRAEQYAPTDPHYEEVVDQRTGKKKKVKRKVPDGLSKRDAAVLKKVRKRAHYLDKGMNLCGFRVGWTFWIGIVPGLGDVVNAGLNYFLVVKPSKRVDIPKELLAKMLANNAVSVALGLVPLVGDVGLAAWKANSRNAHLLEAYLTIRAQEYLASLGQGQSGLTAEDGLSPEDVRVVFAPGSGW